MAFKIVISEPKTRKAWQIEKEVPSLVGLKIGDKFDGSMIGLSGFTLQITGGSDKDGFPMRPDLSGDLRKKVILTKGIGFRGVKKKKKGKYKVKGLRKRKYVRGNIVSQQISQINVKVIEGGDDIAKILGIQPKEKKEEAEKIEEASQEQPKPEEKTPGKQEDKREETKEEPKPEEKKEGE